MSSNDKQSSGGNMTRKERRAAERASRKGVSNDKGTTKSTGSGGGSGPSIAILSVGAVVIGLVLVVALVILGGGLDGNEATAIEEPDTPAAAEELRDGRTLVADGATPTVEVELFEDPQCPHCQTFTKLIEPRIIAKHVAPGTASLTYRDYIIFEGSLDAAVAMRSADELDGAFWDYHHTLYHNAEDGDFTRSWLADIAESVGLEREAFSDLLDDEGLRDAVSEDMAVGSAAGIGSTPSVLVNGELLVAPTWDDLDAAIEAAASAAE